MIFRTGKFQAIYLGSLRLTATGPVTIKNRWLQYAFQKMSSKNVLLAYAVFLRKKAGNEVHEIIGVRVGFFYSSLVY